MLAGVMDPELHASIVDLGMVDDVAGRRPTATSSSTSRSPPLGCPLRAEIKKEVAVEGPRASPASPTSRCTTSR